MQNLETTVYWQLSNYCKAECSYCPASIRGGEYPEENKDYLKLVSKIADHYNVKLKRKINWHFDGGEPLDLYNLVKILKLAKAQNNTVSLNTNGGKLYVDWWAIEPFVDNLILTFHYWQNPSLINYIIDLFRDKGKQICIKMPIRPDHFKEDMERIKHLEELKNIQVTKVILYKNADPIGGMFSYSENQLLIISGIDPTAQIKDDKKEIIPIIKEKQDFENKTYHERLEEKKNSNPSYLGKLCNVGIEKLVITASGWVSGSNCRNQPLGNIWNDGWAPPDAPQVCGMMACMDAEDQKITKFT